MFFESKKNKGYKIKVEMSKGKVMTTKKGFIVITKGQHYGANQITPEALVSDYIVNPSLISL